MKSGLMEQSGWDAANAVVSEASSDSLGWVSPSVYETGRLVATARWLPGHQNRLWFLVGNQRSDGAWVAAGEYGLVPTLSAVDALLAEAALSRSTPDTEIGSDQLIYAARQGLEALRRLLDNTISATIPDTVAIDLLVPWLVDEINHRLDRFSIDSRATSEPLMVEPLTLPSCFDHDRVVRLRESASLGQSIPAELWHCLEVLGPWAAQAPGVHPTDGAVACSPAATAVWAAGPVPAEVTQASVRYLAAAQERYLGPVPSVVPNTSFERAWVRAAIVRAQYSLPTPHSLLDSLAESLSEGAIGCAPGLPADADTTSTTLFALVSAGRPVDPDILLPFESDSRFCNQVGERASSTVANAHVLEALGEHGERHPARAKRYRSSIAKAEQWLIESQAADGSWTDPRHASRYFATTHCVRALARYASPVAQNAVRKALAWIISTQRPDGGWGRWASTTEETAYALQAIYGITVGVAGDPMGDARRYAADRGYVFLRSTGDLMTDEQYSPLWQDKDLYAPVAIIRAEIASALLLAERQTVTERVAS